MDLCHCSLHNSGLLKGNNDAKAQKRAGKNANALSHQDHLNYAESSKTTDEIEN